MSSKKGRQFIFRPSGTTPPEVLEYLEEKTKTVSFPKLLEGLCLADMRGSIALDLDAQTDPTSMLSSSGTSGGIQSADLERLKSDIMKRLDSITAMLEGCEPAPRSPYEPSAAVSVSQLSDEQIEDIKTSVAENIIEVLAGNAPADDPTSDEDAGQPLLPDDLENAKQEILEEIRSLQESIENQVASGDDDEDDLDEDSALDEKLSSFEGKLVQMFRKLDDQAAARSIEMKHILEGIGNEPSPSADPEVMKKNVYVSVLAALKRYHDAQEKEERAGGKAEPICDVRNLDELQSSLLFELGNTHGEQIEALKSIQEDISAILEYLTDPSRLAVASMAAMAADGDSRKAKQALERKDVTACSSIPTAEQLRLLLDEPAVLNHEEVSIAGAETYDAELAEGLHYLFDEDETATSSSFNSASSDDIEDFAAMFEEKLAEAEPSLSEAPKSSPEPASKPEASSRVSLSDVDMDVVREILGL